MTNFKRRSMFKQWLTLLCLFQSTKAAWLQFGDYEYYIEENEGSTINDAINECGMRSAVLATVKTTEVHNFLKTNATGLSELWLGLFDVGVDSDIYVWSGGSRLQEGEEKWSDGIPNQTLLHCVHTESNTFLWKSDMCSEQRGFVCQRKISTSEWVEFQNYEYLINFAPPLNYSEALDHCRADGGSLATPMHQNVWDFLQSQFLPLAEVIYMGLKTDLVWADGRVVEDPGLLPFNYSPVPDTCFHYDDEFNVVGESCRASHGFVCQRTQPDVWYEFEGNSYLFRLWRGFTQAEAKCECEKYKASLVSITSHEEHHFVRSMAAQLSTEFPHLWIGLENFGPIDSAQFKWSDFSDLSGDTWWNIQQPSEDGRCVVAHGFCTEWNVTSCIEQSGYVCERPIDINDCSDDSCLNQGLCIDEIFGFSCLCTPGYTGDDCSIELTPNGVDFLSDELVLNCSLDQVTASLHGDYIKRQNFGDIDGLVLLDSEGSAIDGCQADFDGQQNIYNFDFSLEFAQCSASQEEISPMYVVVDYIVAPRFKSDAKVEKCNKKILRFDCTFHRPNITDTIVKYFAGKTSGHLSYSISRYESEMFMTKQTTYDITIGERVYIGVTLNLHNNNLLLLQGVSCWISPEKYYVGMDSSDFYYILEDGCPVDDPELGTGANLVYASHESKHVTFSFLPFLWSHSSMTQHTLWVACSVRVCMSEGNSNCEKHCDPGRKRRSVHGEKQTGRIITLDPLIVRDQNNCPVNNPCSHSCFSERSGKSTCSCPRNMYLTSDKTTCADIVGSWWMRDYMWPVQLFTCITTIILWIGFLAALLRIIGKRIQTSF
uniref:ZP domain-containing protein-like n=1 Tax=Phallusia mammillata TaxID=59560 RepID=A0A6F9DYE4_9ASCI|nr:ZP domain-containing protein-like [Phallusia mammillata]